MYVVRTFVNNVLGTIIVTFGQRPANVKFLARMILFDIIKKKEINTPGHLVIHWLIM